MVGFFVSFFCFPRRSHFCSTDVLTSDLLSINTRMAAEATSKHFETTRWLLLQLNSRCTWLTRTNKATCGASMNKDGCPSFYGEHSKDFFFSTIIISWKAPLVLISWSVGEQERGNRKDRTSQLWALFRLKEKL